MEVTNSTSSCNISETDQESRDVFCQMDLLRSYNDDLVWKEVRRWVKFEEVLEEKGKRWSKPHVSSLHMQRLTELQMLLASNPILLDLEVSTMSQLADALLERWRSDGHLEPLLYNHVRAILMKRHKHHHINRKQVKRSESKRQLNQMLTLHDGGYDSAPSSPATKRPFERHEKSFPDLTTVSAKLEKHENTDMSKSLDHLAFDAQPNKKFLRKIPEGSEVCNILVGHVEDLKSSLAAFVRLKDAKDLGNITEVPLPTKFVFILLVPKDECEHSPEIGRCIGTLMTDWLFREVAYSCMDKVTLMSAVMEFASQVTVLPPGCWDPKTRIDPPEILPSKESRKSEVSIEMSVTLDDSHVDDTLERTGRLFGGLIKDIKRKAPWYRSDFTDAAHMQCFASFFYLFLATLTPNVAFGGLLGVATDQYMGTMECILSSAVSGVIFALFSAQPLNILGSTGPMLVLEMILYNLCKDNGWDFLPARVWVGFWMALYILLIVAFDLSSLVKYITRFTEESFACLIALIFIYQAVAKTISIQNTSPLQLHPSPIIDRQCLCIIGNFSTGNDSNIINTTSIADLTTIQDTTTRSNGFGFEFATDESHIQTTTISPYLNTTSAVAVSKFSEWMENCTVKHGTLRGDGCDLDTYVPDVFLFSILIFIGTAAFAFCFVAFRNSLFCPTVIRQTVSDFSVLLSILIMVGIDLALGLPTPKLTVPSEFKPTRSDRGWFINPISDNPWWLVIVSSVPALLGTILIFMDQQITSVIVNRKENKLKKGGGYHLDMLVVAVLVVILSLLGLPWYVAATVTAIAHVMSLKKVSECTAPGEKPVFLGVREQRVTALLVGVFSGLAVLITSVLQYIPMPVLYGIFFFMGVSALNGMQLVDRLLIMFMPQKYQPDLPYLRHVPLPKVHLFTAIQILCLAILWVVKSVKVIAIGFPLMVVAICFVRKGLEFFYSEYELKWIDDLLPSFKKEDEDGLKPMDKQSIISLHDHGSGGRKKFQRSLSVPASVHASGTTSSTDISVGSYMDLPYIHRAISSESLSKVVMLSTRNLSKRKLSLLSLPVNPSFVLDETPDEKVRAADKTKTGIYKQNSHSHV